MMYKLLLVSATMAFIYNPSDTMAQLPNGQCSAPIEGTLGSNIINVIEDVSDQETCDKLCQDEEECLVYTYHPASNPTSPGAQFN